MLFLPPWHTIWLAHGIPVIHNMIPKAFSNIFLQKYKITLWTKLTIIWTYIVQIYLNNIFELFISFLEYDNPRQITPPWQDMVGPLLALGIPVIHIINHKAFFRYFLHRNYAINPLVYVLTTQPLRDAPIAVHASVEDYHWIMKDYSRIWTVQDSSRYHGTLWMAQGILLIHIIIPKGIFNNFSSK